MQTLNFEASNRDKTLPTNCVSPNLPGLKNRRWVKGVVLYGANASGKSTLIEAMHALAAMVRTSAQTTDPEDPIPQIEPFGLDAAVANEPTAFAVAFVNGGVRYEYRVAATQTRICHESLRAFPSGKEQLWFSRDWSDEKQGYTFEPENPSGLSRNRDLEERTLPNMLYLSKAIAENRRELEPVFRWLVSHLKFLDLSSRRIFGGGFTLRELENRDSLLTERILKMLRHADLGIDGARVVERLLSDDRTAIKFLEALREETGQSTQRTISQPELTHRGPHGKSLPLPWDRESAGTHRFFALIGPWLDILSKGYTVCVDELDTSMHPLMVRELLKLIFSEEENSKGTQLVFTTHNPLFLDASLIRRDQVWFTDKDEEGAAHLYPLTAYQPRQGESLVRGYLAGRYGAVPFVPHGLLGNFPVPEPTPGPEGDA